MNKRASFACGRQLCAISFAPTIEYVEYPDEDHGLSRYRASVRDQLVRIERFLFEHLKLDKPREKTSNGQ